MHGLGVSLRSAVTGLTVAKESLSITAGNVSNANTEGYSRKVVQQSAQLLVDRVVGSKISGITRNVDNFLTEQVLGQEAQVGRTNALADYHDKIQTMVLGNPGDPDIGLGRRMDSLSASIEAAAANPQEPASDSGIIYAAQTLFDDLSSAAELVQELRRDADQRIADLVQTTNVQLEAIHDLNLQITSGGAPTDLLDQRDMLVREVVRNLDATTFVHDDGMLAIYAPGGSALLEYEPRTLSYQAASMVGFDSGFPAVRIATQSQLDKAAATGADPATVGKVLVSEGVRKTVTAELQAMGYTAADAITSPVVNGRLGGLLQARDEMLPGLGDQLREMGQMLSFSLNEMHSQTTAVPPPAQLTGSRTDFADIGTATGTLTLSLVDRTTLDINATATVDLTTITSAADLVAAINGQAGFAGVASIDASGQFALDSGAAGTGLAMAVEGTEVTTSDAAGHDWRPNIAHYLGLNSFTAPIGSDPTRLSVNADLRADPARLGNAVLDTSTTPPVLGGQGDNTGFRRLAEAATMTLLTADRSTLAASNTDVESYLANVIGQQAISADYAERAQASDVALMEELDFRSARVSGVNLDEEMANLIILQQAYASSARVIDTVDQLFQELLDIAR